jgi:NTE family protein
MNSGVSDTVKDGVKKVGEAIKSVLGMPKKVGLVLGGGGARGMAHIGVLKVLVENKVPVHLIAGTSSGALFGALFCGGMNPYDMAKQAKEENWLKLVKFSLSISGAVRGEGIEKLITDNIGNKNIEDLRIPLSVIATDLKTGEKVVMTKGNIAKAVHASSAIPGVFAPVLFQNRLLADGLVVDNVPVTIGKEMGAEFIIAVDVVPDVRLNGWEPNALNVIERALDVNCRLMSEREKKLADVVIDPLHENFSALSLEKAQELIELGEAAAQEKIAEIMSKLNL